MNEKSWLRGLMLRSDNRKSQIPKITSATFVAFVLTCAMEGPLVQAQQPAGKVPRLGFLAFGSPSGGSSSLEEFRKELGELGYVEAGTSLLSTNGRKADKSGYPVWQMIWSEAR